MAVIEEQSEGKIEQTESKPEQAENSLIKSDIKVERREGESRIDYHIRATRKSLTMEALYEKMRPIDESNIYKLHDFSTDLSRGPVVRSFLWRSIKLMALYLAKGYISIVHWVKRK